MSNRPAIVTQADVARVIRAARKAGAAEVEVKIGGASVIVRMKSTGPAAQDEPEREIVL